MFYIFYEAVTKLSGYNYRLCMLFSQLYLPRED